MDGDEAFRLAEGKGLKERATDRTGNGGRGANAEGETENTGDGNRRSAQQATCGRVEIGEHGGLETSVVLAIDNSTNETVEAVRPRQRKPCAASIRKLIMTVRAAVSVLCLVMTTNHASRGQWINVTEH